MGSTIYLGFTALIFLISYGLIFLLMPLVFNTVFTVIDQQYDQLDPTWANMYNTHKQTVAYMAPLAMSAGLAIFALKIFMAATVRGGD